MSPQKRNKIIVSIVLLGIIIFLIVFIRIQNSSKLVSDKDLVTKCEQELKKQNKDVQVCKIHNAVVQVINKEDTNGPTGKQFNIIISPTTSLEFVDDAVLDTNVNPSDKIIISLDIKNILLKNILNNKTSTNSQLQDAFVSNKPISLCAVVYPVMISDKFNNLTEQEKEIALQQYQENFKWQFFSPSIIFVKVSDKTNVICSKPFIIKNKTKDNTNTLSFIMTLPPKDILTTIGKGIIDPDVNQYGIKLLLTNQTFVNNQKGNMPLEENVRQNYNLMKPLIIFKHWIKL